MTRPVAMEDANSLPAAAWQDLLGQEVVIDLRSPYVCLGRLVAASSDFFVLDDADLHDLRETSTTRERYVLDCQQHGVQPNRRRTWISLREIVAITRLADVLFE